MLYYKIVPKSLPSVKFAHYFAKKDYKQEYFTSNSQIELVYVKNGYFDVEIYGKHERVPQGSFLIFCRKSGPSIFKAEKGIIHMHYTCDIELDYDCTLTDNVAETFNSTENVLLLPFYLPPSEETKRLSKKLIQIVNDYNATESNSLACAITTLGLLGELSQICKSTLFEKNDISSSILCYKIKRYISANITKQFTLADVAKDIGKSPNYLNSVFSKVEGTSIGQYIAREKIHMLIELKKTRDISFDDACRCVGITDISYGYRLFKKHIGTTPKVYFENLKYT
ncbi:MAG: helix-turn-helix transcriptional regulator [Clostridia bacterium]|nr:helix-turn-helix transcriptional regulator [Clostridia bacterium]